MRPHAAAPAAVAFGGSGTRVPAAPAEEETPCAYMSAAPQGEKDQGRKVKEEGESV